MWFTKRSAIAKELHQQLPQFIYRSNTVSHSEVICTWDSIENRYIDRFAEEHRALSNTIHKLLAKHISTDNDVSKAVDICLNVAPSKIWHQEVSVVSLGDVCFSDNQKDYQPVEYTLVDVFGPDAGELERQGEEVLSQWRKFKDNTTMPN